jgi:hypothetical protein
MTARKKSVVHLEFFVENQRWAAKGPRIRVEGPTLQATRRRARKAAEELHGPEVEIQSVLLLSAALTERIERNKKRRAELRRARAELRQDTVELLDHLRNTLGASYEDAGELLGVDASVLMRLVHSSARIPVSDDED